MPRVFSFHVSPCLPPALKCLNELSLNLRWCWDHPTIELFRGIDPDLWEQTGHNPRLMFGRIDQRRLAALAVDEAFLAQMERAKASLCLLYTSSGRRLSEPEQAERRHQAVGALTEGMADGVSQRGRSGRDR